MNDLAPDARELIDLMGELDADDRNWMMAVMRALALVEDDDSEWLLNAVLRHRRADLRRRLDRFERHPGVGLSH